MSTVTHSPDSDRPCLEQPTKVRDLEVRAMAAYRNEYPNGPLWQELHGDTRQIWVAHIERQEQA
jgi:hypothetical protein